MRTPTLSTPAASRSKAYRICPECPFFCRTEELIVRCPWCRLRLLSRCACGEEIADPAAPECARCGAARRHAGGLASVAPLEFDPVPAGDTATRR